MNFKSIKVMVIGLAFLTALNVNASELPPEKSLLLSDVVKQLEAKGYAPITEISMDNGVWEVEAFMKGKERELKVNPLSAEVISDNPDN